jgi:putative inorganic carbon (hco3(-)) transporter
MAGLCFLNVTTIVMSFSRGGALALGAVMLLMLLRSKRKVIGIIGLAVMALPAILLVSQEYFARIATLGDVTSESSARGRLELAKLAWRVAQDHPAFGVGFGSLNFVNEQERYSGYSDIHVAHNNYLQILVDSGVFALFLYVCILFGCIFWLNRIKNKFPKNTPGWIYSVGLQTSLVGFAVGSTFLSRVTFDFVYVMFMMVASWYLLSKQPAVVDASAQPAVPEPAAGAQWGLPAAFPGRVSAGPSQ